jgi:hypothetical protein
LVDDSVVGVDVRAGLESAAPLGSQTRCRDAALSSPALSPGEFRLSALGGEKSGAGEASAMASVVLAAMPEKEKKYVSIAREFKRESKPLLSRSQ